MTRYRTIPLMGFALLTASCDLKPIPPGLDLTDGCYYAGGVPVLKIAGDDGTVIAPGNLRHVKVAGERDENNATAIFTPGFHIVTSPALRVMRQDQSPRSFFMMKPFTSEPVIMVPTDPLGLVDLTRGKPC